MKQNQFWLVSISPFSLNLGHQRVLLHYLHGQDRMFLDMQSRIYDAMYLRRRFP